MSTTIFFLVNPHRKRLPNRGFLEQGDAEDLENFSEAPLDIELLLDHSDEHVHADGDPDLGSHRVVRGSIESLDPKVLFYPFEEQFHTPASLVKLCNDQRNQREVIRQIGETSLRFIVIITDAPERVRIVRGRLWAMEDNRLITTQASSFVDRRRETSRAIQVSFGTSNIESICLIEQMQSLEIYVSSVHDVEGARFERQIVQGIHIVQFSRGNSYETRDAAA